MTSYSRRRWWAVSIISAAWVLWMTLRPDGTLNQINLIPMAEHGRALTCFLNQSCDPGQALRFLLIDVVGNIVVFIPLGIGLGGILHRTNPWQTVRRAALSGFLFSLSIESLQLAIPSRASDIDDIIFNTLGVIIGALLYLAFARKKFTLIDT